MYRINDIKEGLSPLIGWRQDYGGKLIAESLTKSESGRYFQEFHPLLTLDNLRALAPDNMSNPAWRQGVTYEIGSRVSHSGGNYKAIKITQSEPRQGSTDWIAWDLFSGWLEDKTKGSIAKAISSFWDEKLSEKSGRNILESKTLFDGSGRLTDFERSKGNLVGFEIVPVRADGVVLRIDRIGLQIQGPAKELTIYLMHSSSVEPVQIISLSRSKNGTFEWFAQEDLYLPYKSIDLDSGGSWYLVYDQTELGEGTHAINKTRDWSAKPCGSCNSGELASYRVWSQYLEVHPFKVNGSIVPRIAGADDFPEDYVGPINLWDVSQNLYTYTSNYGLNLQITLECDITDIILEQRKSFQNIIGLQLAADMLREMTYNPNFIINRNTHNMSLNKNEILYELDGDSQGYKKSGIMHQLTQSVKAISLNMNTLSKVCFPCKNGGVRFRTI